MVKLTAELIEMSPQYINPVRDRQLDLRGYRIPVIENLGATLDQFDSIDFSDNDIRKLDGFPQLKRLKSLYFNNNSICRIAENLHESIPNLQTLVLTNNKIQKLGDIDPLASLKNLTVLSLMKNDITKEKHYRLYIIHKLPQLRLLDFRKVKQKEKEESAKMFKGKKGKQIEKEIGKKSKTFVPGGNLPNPDKTKSPAVSNAAAVEAIREAIKKATTLEEVERLKQMLRAGQIPNQNGQTEEEMEVDEPGTSS